MRYLRIFLTLLCFQWTAPANAPCAKSSSTHIRINYSDNLIDISTQGTELKTVLVKLAEIANIRIVFPTSLEKKISINKRNISLKETLKRLLKDFNYVVFYSGTSRSKSSVSKVLIYSEAEKTRRLTAGQQRTARRIKIYERQLDSLRQRLAGSGRNSNRTKQLQRRIGSLEKRIENLQRQMY